MICTCRASLCGRAYWRYRRDVPAPGYCSATCEQLGKAEQRGVEPPHLIAVRLRRHVADAHLGYINDWFEKECETCEYLEAALAQSMAYHDLRQQGAA